eukprot:1161859-Pelagomonas_calceolata.AAC.23
MSAGVFQCKVVYWVVLQARVLIGMCQCKDAYWGVLCKNACRSVFSQECPWICPCDKAFVNHEPDSFPLQDVHGILTNQPYISATPIGKNDYLYTFKEGAENIPQMVAILLGLEIFTGVSAVNHMRGCAACPLPGAVKLRLFLDTVGALGDSVDLVDRNEMERDKRRRKRKEEEDFSSQNDACHYEKVS